MSTVKRTHFVWRWLDNIGLPLLLVLALPMLVLPWPMGEAHVLSKVKLLAAGESMRKLDYFDLFMHTLPSTILLLKFYRLATMSSATLVKEEPVAQSVAASEEE